jgi:hypothetical protein
MSSIITIPECDFKPSAAQLTHLKRISTIGKGAAKRRPKAQYQAMGKARWKKYYADKKLLAKAIRSGLCGVVAEK